MGPWNPIRLPAVALFMSLIAIPPTGSRAESTDAQQSAELQRVVTPHIQRMLPDGIGGVAVAVRIDGRTLFLNYGLADAASNRPVTSDSLFNLASLRKPFEATLLALAVDRGELRLDDPIDKYVTELARGHDIRRVTIGQLATHTSGLLLPQDHVPWPDWGYTLPHFLRTLKAWRADAEQSPGKQYMYTHGGYVLLQLALERRFGMPIAALLEQRVLQPLGLSSTVTPPRDAEGRAALAPALMARAVQGYSEDGEPTGKPGDQQTYYHFPGTGQMFSSARDLAVFLAANLGETDADAELKAALQATHEGRFAIGPHNAQALAWEVQDNVEPPIVDKNGGMNNSSTYIGMMPQRQLGIVLLVNRGSQDAAEIGRRILEEIAAP
jgi:beta-lactamase class C